MDRPAAPVRPLRHLKIPQNGQQQVSSSKHTLETTNNDTRSTNASRSGYNSISKMTVAVTETSKTGGINNGNPLPQERISYMVGRNTNDQEASSLRPETFSKAQYGMYSGMKTPSAVDENVIGRTKSPETLSSSNRRSDPMEPTFSGSHKPTKSFNTSPEPHHVPTWYQYGQSQNQNTAEAAPKPRYTRVSAPGNTQSIDEQELRLLRLARESYLWKARYYASKAEQVEMIYNLKTKGQYPHPLKDEELFETSEEFADDTYHKNKNNGCGTWTTSATPESSFHSVYPSNTETQTTAPEQITEEHLFTLSGKHETTKDNASYHDPTKLMDITRYGYIDEESIEKIDQSFDTNLEMAEVQVDVEALEAAVACKYGCADLMSSSNSDYLSDDELVK